jgi:hypothetical protein
MSVIHSHASMRCLRGIFAAVLCLGILLPGSAAYAANLSAVLSDTATEGCRRAAQAEGYKVERVISAKEGLGDRTNVVLELSKANERFEFSCAYSEALRKLPAVAAAPAIRQEAALRGAVRTAQAPAPARVDANRNAGRPTARRVDEQRVAQRGQADLDTRSERRGIPALGWLLPLLLLIPLVALLLRRNTEEPVVATMPVVTKPVANTVKTSPATATTSSTSAAPVKVGSYLNLAVLRNQGELIPVYAAASTTSTASSSLADGQSVSLSGRREGAWAELEKGGWIETRFISAEDGKV